MQLTRNKIILIVFSAAIIALVAANAYLLLFPAHPKDDAELQAFKDFAEESHAQVQGILLEAENLSVSPDPDLNAEEQQQMELLEKSYESTKSDVRWLAETENATYEKILASSTKEEAENEAAKEVGTLLLGSYILTINQFVMEGALSEAADASAITEEAEILLPEIQVTRFLGEESFTEPADEADIAAQKIEDAFYELFDSYLQFEKQGFAAEKDADIKFFEAEKLIGLYYIFTEGIE